ncbi:CHAT domain containing protein [Lactarius tabidus]
MSSSMQSQMSSPLSDSNLVLDAALSNALNDYMAITGQELLEHPLSAEAQQSDSVDSILAIFQGQVEALRQFRAGNQILMNWISPVVNILFKFSEMLGGVATVAFPPAGAIFSGISILLAAAKDVNASHDALVELFERIESVFKRLGVYTQISLTTEMAEVFVKIVVEVLSILSIATKEMTRNRTNIYFRRLLGRAGIENAIQRLDSLIQEEVRMAIAQTMRATFDLRDASIADIDHYLQIPHYSLSLCSPSDFSSVLDAHSMEQVDRDVLPQQKEDLDKFIVDVASAIFLPPLSGVRPYLNIVQLLFLLTLTLLQRSEKFKRPEDIKYSIMYLRYLRGLSLDSVDISRSLITTSLIRALAIQVKWEDRDGTQDIEEMVILCRELLTSDLSAGFPVAAFTSLNGAVDSEFIRGRVQSLNQVIDCLRDGLVMCPLGSSSHLVLFALANTLYTRFIHAHLHDDYEKATALLEWVLDQNRSGGCQDSLRDQASSLATMLPIVRSAIFRNPEYSEVATFRLRTALVNSFSVDDGLRLQFTNILAIQARERFRQYRLPENLEDANYYTSQVVDSSPSQSLEEFCPESLPESYSVTKMADAIQTLEGLLSSTPPGSKHHKQCLDQLVRRYKSKFYRTNDKRDIKESVKYNRLLLNATHSSDPMRSNPLSSLRDILLLAFKKTRDISYLDESISIGYHILRLNSARHIHFGTIIKLALSLVTRWWLFCPRKDPREAIQLMSSAVNDPYAQEPERFQLSCMWALIARIFSHPSALAAYESAMSLVKKSFAFAPTASVQYARLVAMGENCHNMPLDYASFQISFGQIEGAIETLERGRTLLWSELRGFRTPMAQLIEDSSLAKRFTEINQELEVLTVSVTPSGMPEFEDVIARGTYLADPFGRLVLKQRKLVQEQDALISQIQRRPGLGGFSNTPSFATLRFAASRGPVVLINHCKWRSDILILSGSFAYSIPTVDDFYDRANKLRDELVQARKHGLDSYEHLDALRSVLKGLYVLVGEPVIERLRKLGVPEKSRIWWCPTSVFCSLPLHAMGPIPSSDTVNNYERYFLDLYIPSYTTSLSALLESHQAGPQMLDKPSLLLVAQPGDPFPGIMREIKAVQRVLKSRVTMKYLIGEATPTSVLEGLRGCRFAHFACLGALETGKPFEASLELSGGSRLTLLDIVRYQFPRAEFAFLSCGHTAEITEGSIPDEALHLTAAMQHCGFRSVVGAMWEVTDVDGQDLAKSFYRSLFSSKEADVPYHERSAGALRDAVRKLRRKRLVTLDRWVNFVHYGA